MDGLTQIVNELATGDTDKAVYDTREHIKRYARSMKQGVAKKYKG